MSFASPKLTGTSLRSPFLLNSHYSSFPSLNGLLFPSSTRKPFINLFKPVFSLRTERQRGHGNRSRSNSTRSSKPSSPRLGKWPSSNSPRKGKISRTNGQSKVRRERVSSEAETEVQDVDKDKGQRAIEGVVFRLRNLVLGSNDEDEDEDGDEEEEEEGKEEGMNVSDSLTLIGEEKLEDLLRREWVQSDTVYSEGVRSDVDLTALPWERDGEKNEKIGGESVGLTKTSLKAPSLAELTIEEAELRRLRRMGMYTRERISVPKAGITQAVLEKIHNTWRKEELVRLKFHEVLARDMKTGHEVVERRTGGLVIWRSGSVMVVYRGTNYAGPPMPRPTKKDGETLFVSEDSSGGSALNENVTLSIPEKGEPARIYTDRNERMEEVEAEYNSLLDELGPRFYEWWGTGVLPVDADLLPPKVPGYKTPFRLLPARMRPRLTNAEMTNLRKVAKSLPCHFALGRNRNHQGLAVAILKIWEKSLVAKIAVKRGIQNTNNKIMAEELKDLTGGVLLLRNKYFIVIYRGKDFIPTGVASVLAERQELTKEIQDVEEQVRSGVVEVVPLGKENGQPNAAGTLAEFYEAQARWGREISPDEREKMIEEASIAKQARVIKTIEHRLGIAQSKKLRAEKLLAKIEVSMVPSGPDCDQETITDEERIMFRRVGLRMKAYLPLGIRGVFDGVIENMHLHWKHRELVKLITKQKTLAFVEDTARLLEYESGGILVSIVRVPKGYALIYYRGKNYQRPIALRPRNLLNKGKALKRAVAMQRHEALSEHISQVEENIEQMKKKLIKDEKTLGEPGSSVEDEDDDSDWEADEESESQLSSFEDGDESWSRIG